jgi:hypothetical protein
MSVSTCTTDHRGEMRARETQLKNFFQNVEAALRGVGNRTNAVSRWEVSVCYIVCACVCVCVCEREREREREREGGVQFKGRSERVSSISCQVD